ncbi:MAG: TIGR03576 family pyridoxal phosphate-dependent enzyme [Methanobrevibacter sp.]|jgi:L-seryl-tRNA(Ser) seleniumtransferase|nr:TIGR03576 family pyridoxal phosphate-dependent enzyme [Candidatus Methanovirga aequatorialis]
MLVDNLIDEVKKRENSLKIIRDLIKDHGRENLYDLTGLSGGFIANQNDLNLLETYVGPAIFEEDLNKLGKEHLGGERILAVNRTSSGILATILTLLKPDSYLIHFLVEPPSHPSIIKSVEIAKGRYLEFDKMDEFHVVENTSLIVITGSTMDHKVLDEETFKKIITTAHEQNVPVFVDDASGARLRTVIYNQKRAIDLGADLVVTSTDKLMPGPRGGLIAGNADLVDKIKTTAYQFGLEAQPPLIMAIINGLKAFKKESLLRSIEKKERLMKMLNGYSMFEETPTGVMVSKERLKHEINSCGKIDKQVLSKIEKKISSSDLCFIWALILLKNESIITIPAVSMPGASPTVRFDISSKDALNLDMETLHKKIDDSFKKLLDVIKDLDGSKRLLYGD